MESSDIVEIVYTNYRGETSTRRVRPIRVWFGSTEWHPEPQWLLEAVDEEKCARRHFAMTDVHSWSAAELANHRR